MWHMLQVSDAIDREFLSALNDIVPTIGWKPRMDAFGMFKSGEEEQVLKDPPELIRWFPLQKGYTREPIASIVQAGRKQVDRMLRVTADPLRTPLICTTPYWADVAKAWPGPVVYYLTDLMFAYDGVNPTLIKKLDVQMCKAATLVCPNSSSIRKYLIEETGCDPAKIEIVPNATRQSNLLNAVPSEPGPLPADLEGLPRPIAGVIGNLASNMDWEFLVRVIERTPEFSWAFVGPTDMKIPERPQRMARAKVMQMGGRVRFVGGKQYGDLCKYARTFDVAVLPYFKREPTLSGSSTRFYEHLAACRPMLSTHGFRELLSKEPLLRLVECSDDTVEQLKHLHRIGFVDGYAEERWLASRNGTWTCRAKQIIKSLSDRFPNIVGIPSEEPAVVERHLTAGRLGI